MPGFLRWKLREAGNWGLHHLPAPPVIVLAHVAEEACSAAGHIPLQVRVRVISPAGAGCLLCPRRGSLQRSLSYALQSSVLDLAYTFILSTPHTLEDATRTGCIFKGTSRQNTTVQKSVSKTCYLTAQHLTNGLSVLSRPTWPGVGR